MLSTPPTTPVLPDAKTSPNPENPIHRNNADTGNGDVLTGGTSPMTQKSKNFVENSGKDFGASVAELRKKAQEHSAAIWQSLQLAQQQQSNATATTLASALSGSCGGHGLASNPFLSSDLKEINFNLLPGVGGLAGLSWNSPQQKSGSRKSSDVKRNRNRGHQQDLKRFLPETNFGENFYYGDFAKKGF